MRFEIGKVINFDGHNGEILASSGVYSFLDVDIIERINQDDYVLFRGEKVNDINRAYFVKYFSKDITNVEANKVNLERLLKKEDGDL